MAASRPDGSSEVLRAFKTCRAAMMSVGVFSLFINLLMLTGPLFMLQVYDRVLSSGSMPTLVALMLLVSVLHAFYGFLEFVRLRVVGRIARIVDERLRDRVFDSVAYHALRQTPDVRTQPIQDLHTIRAFLQGPGPLAFLDMPWVAVYVAVIFLMHTLLGATAAFALMLLVVITIINDRVTRRSALAAQRATQQAGVISEESRTNVEVAAVLGMLHVIRRRWSAAQDSALDWQMLASDRGGLWSSLSRSLRLLFQSGILAVGAYLVIEQQISAGTMIAASIMMSRGLAPVESAVAHWGAFQAFRRSWERLGQCLRMTPADRDHMDLPAPTGQLSVDNLVAFVPGAEKPLLSGVSFELAPGAGLGIVGPTGAGKSTLARAIVGGWPYCRGSIRLDGATLDQWNAAVLGRHLGYLPQDVELFDGTLAENISRFQADPDPRSVVKAAQQAGVHELVLRMPEGYDTRIGEGGAKLSAGQRQRIGLARALFGEPKLLVLDEPNSNLDAEGEAALTRAIGDVRRRGGTVIVVAHRPSAIASLDQLMMLRDGRVVAFGPKDEVRKHVMAGAVASQSHGGLAVVSENRT